VGLFNVYNVLGSVAAAVALGMPFETIASSIGTLPQVRGRMERVALPNGAIAIVDFAHTPDALQRALETLRTLVRETGGKIITVFGCGGDRDKTKRPLMGAIASVLSDSVIVTSDNPRTEDPAAIITDVLNGIESMVHTTAIIERGEAVNAALAQAGTEDVVLIAGKGHEPYQIIGDKKYPYDDLEIVRAWIRRMTGDG
jgi:UDP-N-acetylmuramoyl-L-alanyl-D-glutamate--2,6-diaminopimelate ligase